MIIGWLDSETVDNYWDDAPVDVVYLEMLLAAAYEQCIEYAPETALLATETDRFALAQLMQTKALYRSMLSGSNDQIGADGFAITVWPMDRVVKNLLRPRKVGRVL